MKKSKTLTITLIVLVTLTLLAVVAVVLLTQLNKEPKAEEAKPIEEVILASVDVPEITTNLADGSFARLTLKVETDSEDAAGELTQRLHQVNNIVIYELSELTTEDLKGKQGKVLFEKAVKAQINELMQEGEVQKVYMTSFIVQ